MLAKGEVRCGGDLHDISEDISEALAGELVGVADLPTGDRVIRFAKLDLGVIEASTAKFRRFSAPNRETVNHVPGPTGQSPWHF